MKIRKNPSTVEKTVYFVRHGQSEDNARPVFQAESSPLTERGRNQAAAIAERAKNIEFEALISSPSVRTRQTAEEVSKATGKQIEFSDLFVERAKPSSVQGKSYDDDEAMAIYKKWEESLFKSGIRVQDGENFDDLMIRADRAMSFLEERPESNILVVTHGFFLRTLVIKAVLKNSFTEENFKDFHYNVTMKNTGLTALQYARYDDGSARWRLWVYNDHSHLG